MTTLRFIASFCLMVLVVQGYETTHSEGARILCLVFGAIIAGSIWVPRKKANT